MGACVLHCYSQRWREIMHLVELAFIPLYQLLLQTNMYIHVHHIKLQPAHANTSPGCPSLSCNFVKDLPDNQTNTEIAQYIDAKDEYFELSHVPLTYCRSSPWTNMVIVVNESLRIV